MADAAGGGGDGNNRGGAITAFPPPGGLSQPESPRQQRLRTPSARPAEPPPSTFVHGLSPRAPRSIDYGKEFEEELLNEYRAASRAARYLGAKPHDQAALSPSMRRLDEAVRQGVSVAEAVGVVPKVPAT